VNLCLFGLIIYQIFVLSILFYIFFKILVTVQSNYVEMPALMINI